MGDWLRVLEGGVFLILSVIAIVFFRSGEEQAPDHPGAGSRRVHGPDMRPGKAERSDRLSTTTYRWEAGYKKGGDCDCYSEWERWERLSESLSSGIETSGYKLNCNRIPFRSYQDHFREVSTPTLRWMDGVSSRSLHSKLVDSFGKDSPHCASFFDEVVDNPI